MKKNHKLTLEPEPSQVLLGIISGENDYTLSFQINKHMAVQLNKADDFIKNNAKSGKQERYSCYKTISNEGSDLQLYKNKEPFGALVHEFKDIDYFMVLPAESESNFINNIIQQLKNIPVINAVYLLKTEKIKVIPTFLFD